MSKATTLRLVRKSLRDEFDVAVNEVGKSILTLNWEDREIYLDWLAQHYHLVRHTMRYICLAAGLSPKDDDSSYQYWARALKGEHNHHKLLERDAEAVGGTIQTYPVRASAERVVKSVKAAMIDSDGKALFGYALLLEGLSCAVGEELRKRVEVAHGKKATSFLRVHAEEDSGDDGHYVLGIDYIDKNYSASDQQAILSLLSDSAGLYQMIVSELLESRSEVQYQKHG